MTTACCRRVLTLLSMPLLALVLVLVLATPQLRADEAVLARLSVFTESLSSFTSDFTQTVYDADSNPLQSSSGTVQLKRPGRFIWDYTEPTVQQIIADGQKVWLYDVELEQVTVSPLSEQGAGTPLALLMGETPLEEEFSVKSLGNSEGIDWIELTPVAAGSDFEQVFIGLDDNGLAAMELRDSFGQATQIRFQNFNDDVVLDDAIFQFVPPAGVDVIGQG